MAQHCLAALQKEKAKISSAFEKPTQVAPTDLVPPLTKRNFHLRHPNWFLNWQIKNEGALLICKGLSEGGGQEKLAENLLASLFYKYISNGTTFSLIHLAGQYL